MPAREPLWAAAEDREHASTLVYIPNMRPPQWSRLPRIGELSYTGEQQIIVTQPQWGRPLRTGSIGVTLGAAVSQFQPQWSRSLTTGSTALFDTGEIFMNTLQWSRPLRPEAPSRRAHRECYCRRCNGAGC